jgi:hypothetical protein
VSRLIALSVGRLVSIVFDLKVHLVYAVSNADGVIVYAGQTQMSLMSRVKSHLSDVFRKVCFVFDVWIINI